MKQLFAITILALATLAAAQTTNLSNIYAAGVSGSPTAQPPVAGTALYAHLLDGNAGTYAFTVWDALPDTYKPFTVTTNVGIGIAQKAFTVGKFPIYVPTSAGIEWNGKNTGWQWSSGGLAAIKLHGAWRILPNVRFLKSSVSNGSDYQVIAGLMFGTGW